MNKKLLLLPGVAMLALTSCTFDITSIFGGKGKKALKELDKAGAVVKEFQGHKIATKVKDGGEYYLGVYRKNEDLMRFGNGDYHHDDKGDYPFYMGGTTATLEGAAIATVEMLGNDTFGLRITCSDPSLPWHNKYLGVYGGTSAYNKAVNSLALLDDPEQTTYNTITNHQNTSSETVSCSGIFKFYDYYEDMPACAPGVIYCHEELDVGEATPKFLGTGHNANTETKGEPDYTSIDAKMAGEALDIEVYDLMHLYEI